MSCIHYKFKSSLDYNSVTFDGLHLSLVDLKKAISAQKRLKPGEFDLEIVNAQTQTVYKKNDELISKNTSVIVSRVPVVKNTASSTQRSWEAYKQECASKKEKERQAALEKMNQLPTMEAAPASELDKIKAVIDQSRSGFEPANLAGRYIAGVPNEGYICKRCGKKGHWITNCPNSTGEERVPEPRIKRTTGIPATMLTIVDDPLHPGALLTAGGLFAVPTIDVEGYKDSKKERPPFEAPGASSAPPPPAWIPQELKCNICEDICTDAAIAPCCGTSFCDECLREELLESEDHQCPECKDVNVSPDRIVPNKAIREAVNNFKNDTGYSKIRRRRSNSTGGASTDPPAPSSLPSSAQVPNTLTTAPPPDTEPRARTPPSSPIANTISTPATPGDAPPTPGSYDPYNQHGVQGDHPAWEDHNSTNPNPNLRSLTGSYEKQYDHNDNRSEFRNDNHLDSRNDNRPPYRRDDRPPYRGRPSYRGRAPHVDHHMPPPPYGAPAWPPVSNPSHMGGPHHPSSYMGPTSHPVPILTVPPPGHAPFTALPLVLPLRLPPFHSAPLPGASLPRAPSVAPPMSRSDFYQVQSLLKDNSRSPKKKSVDLYDSFADLTNSRGTDRPERRRSNSKTRSVSPTKKRHSHSHSPDKRRSRSHSRSRRSRSRSYDKPKTSKARSKSRTPEGKGDLEDLLKDGSPSSPPPPPRSKPSLSPSRTPPPPGASSPYRRSKSPYRRPSHSSLKRSKSPNRKYSKSPSSKTPPMLRSRSRSKSFPRFSRSRSKSWSKAKRPRSRSFSPRRSSRSPRRSPLRRSSYSPPPQRRRSRSFSPRGFRSRSRSPFNKPWSPPRQRSRSPFNRPRRSPSPRPVSPSRGRPLSPPRRDASPFMGGQRGGHRGFRGGFRGRGRGAWNRDNRDRDFNREYQERYNFHHPQAPPRQAQGPPAGMPVVPSIQLPSIPGMPPPEEFFKNDPEGYQAFVHSMYASLGPQAQAMAVAAMSASAHPSHPAQPIAAMYGHPTHPAHPPVDQRPAWGSAVPMSMEHRPRSITPPRRNARDMNMNMKDRHDRERMERARLDRERQDRERHDRERHDRERHDRERVERERVEREREDRERLDRERGDRERGDRERGDRERMDRDRRADREREDRYHKDTKSDRNRSKEDYSRESDRKDRDYYKDKEVSRNKDREVSDRRKSKDEDKPKSKDKKKNKDKENKKSKKRSEKEAVKEKSNSKKNNLLSRTSPISDEELKSTPPRDSRSVVKEENMEEEERKKVKGSKDDTNPETVTPKVKKTVKKTEGKVMKKKAKVAAGEDGEGKKVKKTKKKKPTFGSSEADVKQGLKKKKLKRLVDYKSENTNSDGEDKSLPLGTSPAKKLKPDNNDDPSVTDLKDTDTLVNGEPPQTVTDTIEVSTEPKAEGASLVEGRDALVTSTIQPDRDTVTDSTVDSTVKDVKDLPEPVPQPSPKVALPQVSKWERDDYDILDALESPIKAKPAPTKMLPRSVVDKAEKFFSSKPMKNAVTVGHVTTSVKSPPKSPPRKLPETRAKSPPKGIRKVSIDAKKDSKDKKSLDLQITVKSDKIMDTDKSKTDSDRYRKGSERSRGDTDRYKNEYKNDSRDRKQSSSRNEDSRRRHPSYEEDQRSVVRSRSYERESHSSTKNSKRNDKEKVSSKQERSSKDDEKINKRDKKESKKERQRSESPEEPKEKRRIKEVKLSASSETLKSPVKSPKDLRHKIEEKNKGKSLIDRKLSVMDEADFVPDYEDHALDSHSDNEKEEVSSQKSDASSPERKKRKKSDDEGDDKSDDSDKEGGKVKKSKKKHKHKEKTKDKKEKKKEKKEKKKEKKEKKHKKHKHKKSKDKDDSSDSDE